MQSLDLLKVLLDDQALQHMEFRNSLLVGDIDERRLAALVKRAKLPSILLVPGEELTTFDELSSKLMEQTDEGLLVITNFDRVGEGLIFPLASFMRAREIIRNPDENSSDVLKLPEFSLVCVTSPNSTIPKELLELFDIKFFVGASCDIASYDPAESDRRAPLTEKEQEFLEVGQSIPVIAGLHVLEDKIREIGMLVSATGDSQAEISISYELWGNDESEYGPYLVINISTEEERDEVDPDDFEEISDYVNEKIELLQQNWSKEQQEILGDIFGQIVLLNGRKVY